MSASLFTPLTVYETLRDTLSENDTCLTTALSLLEINQLDRAMHRDRESISLFSAEEFVHIHVKELGEHAHGVQRCGWIDWRQPCRVDWQEFCVETIPVRYCINVG